jgi:enamine deaminase RidA (YjgF/YER057c/UK114 family)
LRAPAVDLPQHVHAAILGFVERQLVPAHSPFAPTVGYSRALRAGSHVHVAGTAAIMPDDADPPAEAYGQAKRCLEIVVAALAEVGARPEHVVRTRVYLTAAEDWQEVGRAHGEVFGDVRPASAFIVVTSLLDPRWLVEIEAEAMLE